MLVNIILDGSTDSFMADLNSDNEVNIVDVVILVNQILEN